MQLQGPRFSWSNSSTGASRIDCRLDRVLVNAQFLQNAHKCQGSLLNPGLFDHCPLFISNTNAPIVKISFRYLNAWAKKDDFFTTAKIAWDINVNGTTMFKVVKKLANVKKCLKECNRSQIPVSLEIIEATAKLESIQTQMGNS